MRPLQTGLRKIGPLEDRPPVLRQPEPEVEPGPARITAHVDDQRRPRCDGLECLVGVLCGQAVEVDIAVAGRQRREYRRRGAPPRKSDRGRVGRARDLDLATPSALRSRSRAGLSPAPRSTRASMRLSSACGVEAATSRATSTALTIPIVSTTESETPRTIFRPPNPLSRRRASSS